jgi:hypothetical protein
MSTIYRVVTEVISKDSTGEFDMKVKFNSVKIEADLGPQGKVTFDSDNPADSAKKNVPAFLQFFALIGNHFFVRITPRGEISEIYKVDNILKKLLGPSPEKVNENVKTQLRMGLENQLKSITQQIFQFLPENSIKVDSSWYKLTDEKIDVMSAQNKATYVLKSVSKVGNSDVAHIVASLNTEIIGKRNFEEKGAKFSYDKPDIKANGAVDFDLVRGIVLKRSLSTDVSISVTITQGPKVLKVQSTEKTTIKIDLE